MDAKDSDTASGTDIVSAGPDSSEPMGLDGDAAVIEAAFFVDVNRSRSDGNAAGVVDATNSGRT